MNHFFKTKLNKTDREVVSNAWQDSVTLAEIKL